MKRCLDCQEYTEDNEAEECVHCLSSFEEGSDKLKGDGK